jgi:hypothetical protein
MNELSETPQVGTTEEAHGRARGKRSAWSANQQHSHSHNDKKDVADICDIFFYHGLFSAWYDRYRNIFTLTRLPYYPKIGD